MEITDVRTFRVVLEAGPKSGPFEQGVVHPLDVYAEFRHQTVGDRLRMSAGAVSFGHSFVEILTDSEFSGLYGPFGDERAFVIHHRLRPFLIGRDPLDVERLWHQMFLLDTHARSGAGMWALSAVDCALWDLRGKYYSAPVYELLGGPTRQAISVYASTHGYSCEPQDVRRRAGELRAAGYGAQKWFFQHGPGSGREGLEKNMELARTAAEALGGDSELMFDAWAAWSVPFAVEMARRLQPLDPLWLEEPVSTDLGPRALLAVKTQGRIAIAASEHLYTRWGVRAFLEAGAIDYLQVEPDFCGGITELVRICSLASAHGVKVVPHGNNIHVAAHVAASRPPDVCPMLEYLVRHQKGQQWLNRTPWQPTGAVLQLPRCTGLGFDLDESRIARRIDLSWD